jgi:hypothetical protein
MAVFSVAFGDPVFVRKRVGFILAPFRPQRLKALRPLNRTAQGIDYTIQHPIKQGSLVAAANLPSPDVFLSSAFMKFMDERARIVALDKSRV